LRKTAEKISEILSPFSLSVSRWSTHEAAQHLPTRLAGHVFDELLCTKPFHKEDRKMPIYGYARVSTNGQELGSQEAELLAVGCAKLFKEKVSGAKTDRAELGKALRRLEPGDVLVVTRLAGC
jgi:Resolvase, N terminal domain